MRAARLPLLCFLPAALLLTAAAPAGAFVRTRSVTTNAPLFWSPGRASLEVVLPPDILGLSATDMRGAAQDAVNTWSHPAVLCTSLALSLAPGFTQGRVVAYDGHNRIMMRTTAWCADPDALTDCHDSSQVALTTVFSRNHPGALDDGQILEADIEVNGVDFEWGVIPDGPISGRDYEYTYDLTSALTHETGHFIGLAHVCELPGDPDRFDDHGLPSPACSALTTNAAQGFLLDATMYPMMNPSDTSLRTLSKDDLEAVCSLYPELVPTVIGACAVSPGPSVGPRGGALGAMAACGVACVTLRRRRRRGS